MKLADKFKNIAFESEVEAEYIKIIHELEFCAYTGGRRVIFFETKLLNPDFVHREYTLKRLKEDGFTIEFDCTSVTIRF